jgi:nitroimidazol reductase NimA-like FMN-containing flavoprotein (pyridoxamine 5'-phosphate oxidase superfamily)
VEQQPTVTGTSRIEWLSIDECSWLLRCADVGRVGVVAGGSPLVFPVTFVLDGDAVAFRTGAGTKLAAAGRAPACFEVDAFDPATRTGWSVLVQGRLEEVTRHDARTFDRLEGLGLRPWLDGAGDHWIRLVPESTTGRRLVREGGPGPG